MQAIHKPESLEVGCKSQFGYFLFRNADWLCVKTWHVGTSQEKDTLEFSDLNWGSE